jgi:hypothetical protein
MDWVSIVLFLLYGVICALAGWWARTWVSYAEQECFNPYHEKDHY